MSDIGPGDLVVCVHLKPRGSIYDYCLSRLRVGAAYAVLRVGPFSGSLWLAVQSDHPSGAWDHSRFRKFDEGDSARLSEMFTVKEIANA